MCAAPAMQNSFQPTMHNLKSGIFSILTEVDADRRIAGNGGARDGRGDAGNSATLGEAGEVMDVGEHCSLCLYLEIAKI